MICGQKLILNDYWYITGPVGRKNQSCSDPAMHQECARYSLAICPHMHFEKTERTTAEDEGPAMIIHAKPPQVHLINASGYNVFRHMGYLLSKFYNIISEERYHYVDNVLVQDMDYKP